MLKLVVATFAIGCLAAPLSAHAQMEVVVRSKLPASETPPPARMEAQPTRPSEDHAYVAGYWAWRGSKHVWVPGEWVVPPARGFRWVPARYTQSGREWNFEEGHWIDPAVPVEPIRPDAVTVTSPPPAETIERPTPSPFPDAFGVKGHWFWSETEWKWAPGHWDHTRKDYVFEQPHWRTRGHNRWTFSDGDWKHK